MVIYFEKFSTDTDIHNYAGCFFNDFHFFDLKQELLLKHHEQIVNLLVFKGWIANKDEIIDVSMILAQNTFNFVNLLKTRRLDLLVFFRM